MDLQLASAKGLFVTPRCIHYILACMKIGIVGIPGSGRSTLFAALTGLTATEGLAAKGSVGVIKVPDPRLDRLAQLYQPAKVTAVEMTLYDLFGSGDGQASLTAAHLAQIRQMDLILHVAGFFATAKEATLKSIQQLLDEFLFADLAVIDKRLQRLQKEGKREAELKLLQTLSAHLEANRPLRSCMLTQQQEQALTGYAFISRKPYLLVVNQREEGAEPLNGALRSLSVEQQFAYFHLCAPLEREIMALAADERGHFLKELGIDEPAQAAMIRKSYELMQLISFFTVGKDEVRAWTLKKGCTALEAAGKIHTDLQRGFIRAEVMRYEDLIACGSEKACRKAGKLRLEGKDYVVADGDIFHVRFNV